MGKAERKCWNINCLWRGKKIRNFTIGYTSLYKRGVGEKWLVKLCSNDLISVTFSFKNCLIIFFSFRRRRWTRLPNWVSWPVWVMRRRSAKRSIDCYSEKFDGVGGAAAETLVTLRCCCRCRHRKRSCGDSCWPSAASAAEWVAAWAEEAASSGRAQESDSEWAPRGDKTGGPAGWWECGGESPWLVSKCRHCKVHWHWLSVAAGRRLKDSVESSSVCCRNQKISKLIIVCLAVIASQQYYVLLT